MGKKIQPFYYLNTDVKFLAQDLLGKVLYTNKNNQLTAGIIVETEAYFGTDDKASHAYGGRRTARTETMYQPGGISYIYLCYGIHHLFNIVVSEPDDPKSILIRAVEPFIGTEIIQQRRNRPIEDPAISSGPGSFSKAMGIDMSFNHKDLSGDDIWIEDTGIQYAPGEIASVPRVGVSYAQEHALLPLRFYVKESRYVSRKPRNSP